MALRSTSTVTCVLTVAAVMSVPAPGRAQSAAPATASVDEPPVETRAPASSPAVPISRWRISADDVSPARQTIAHRAPQPRRQAGMNTALKRVLMGAGFGFAGFMAGGIIGAKIDGDCRCDDAGLKGIVIGAPIGAAIGAVVGIALAR